MTKKYKLVLHYFVVISLAPAQLRHQPERKLRLCREMALARVFVVMHGYGCTRMCPSLTPAPPRAHVRIKYLVRLVRLKSASELPYDYFIRHLTCNHCARAHIYIERENPEPARGQKNRGAMIRNSVAPCATL